MVKVNIIVAKDYDNVIGYDNNLVYKIPEDIIRFKTITTGNEGKNVVIMGYNTWKSIPDKYKPLKNRINVILSKRHNVKLKEELKDKNDTFIYDNFDSALEEINKLDINFIFIIGGESLYKYALETCNIDHIYITKIRSKYKNNENSYDKNKISYFPKIKYGKYDTIMISPIKNFNNLYFQYITLKYKE